MLYSNKNSEVLSDPYVMDESKLNDGIVALWPAVKLGQLYTYFSGMPGQFTREKMKLLQELCCLYLLHRVLSFILIMIIFTAGFPILCMYILQVNYFDKRVGSKRAA